MNFKSIALATTLTIGGMFGSVAPAEAATCWFQLRNDTSTLTPSYCSTRRRINANGHVVFDLVDHQGTKVVLVFWNDNTVEIIGLPQGRVMGRTYTDSQGDTRIETAGNFEMAIRF